jgi:tetratricopeptide (TPR) repeat protein
MSEISLCLICGNEATHAARFLETFAPVIDELCLVRAIGNKEPDETVAICEEWARKRGVAYRFAEYKNAPGRDWPHVDNFAAARQMSFDLATCKRVMWADFDDVLPAGMAEKIRAYVDHEADMIFFTYSLPGQHEKCLRERLFRREFKDARWVSAVHENYSMPGARVHADESIRISHEPLANEAKDLARNRRIISAQIEGAERMFYQMGREHYIAAFRAFHDDDSEGFHQEAAQAHRVFTLAVSAGRILPEEQVEAELMRATLYTQAGDHGSAIERAWAAIHILPDRRHAWAALAESYLATERPHHAAIAVRTMMAQIAPPASGLPANTRYFGFPGIELALRCNRALGLEEKTRADEEKIFAREGRKISLVHATRGRPDKAIMARKLWLESASNPAAVEHVFVVDADDAASIDALKHYRCHIVKEPRGCARAWNEGVEATSGAVVIQLSDDWYPCVHWDHFVWSALEAEAKKRGSALVDTPLVLAVDDGHRKDDLLCMAIATRARIKKQEGGTLFAADYFGVFSDTEFSLRAKRDGVIVDGRNIVFEHRHPFWGKAKVDETYIRQNAPERYAEGQAIFERRNPA